MILSPLNYVGNKARILTSLLPLFPQNLTVFVDIFCGSGIVGLNAKSKRLILNDKEKRVMDLLRYFQNNSLDKILGEVNSIIAQYNLTDSKSKPKGFYKIHKNEGLSRHNKDGFLRLRKSYNQHPSEAKFFTLILFGFNHFVRFNAQGAYNVPVGKSDFSHFQLQKSIAFIRALQERHITLLNMDFRENALYKEGDFFYFDPPYLITQAPYNASWNEECEKDLYKILDILDSQNKSFALSNVLISNGKSNDLLTQWSKKYHTTFIKRDYANANYHRKNLGATQEVLITNYHTKSMNLFHKATNMPKNLLNIFSFDTTIRNPQRNIDFLQIIDKIDGKELNEKTLLIYWNEAIGKGIYRPLKISAETRHKLLIGEGLSEGEVKQIMQDNPQKVGSELYGFKRRAISHFKALHSQLLLNLEAKSNIVLLSKIGRELLNRPHDVQNIYTKILLGIHFGSSLRKDNNRARVFLNTIFVIDLLKKEWSKRGKESKGILKHECLFVLGMKDCDYKKCVNEILKYREIYGRNENKKYIENYWVENHLKHLKYETLKTYVDEVFRKFAMSGLIIARHYYYDFSAFEHKKIESILQYYRDYAFMDFSDIYEYIDFVHNIKLPWLENNEVRKQIATQKAQELHIALNDCDFNDLALLENKLNQTFYKQTLTSKIESSHIDTLLNELRILASMTQEKSSLEYIPEPLRLEYLLALILGKKYGSKHLESNLIYNEHGEPLSYAPAGKTDLRYENFSFEATMIKNRNQQLNSETTSIARHFYEYKKQTALEQRAALIAPYIHWDIALFFKFCAKEFDSKLAPISITSFITLI